MKKNKSILVLVLLLAIGFAAVSTTLVLNGTLNLGFNQNDFSVIFTEATMTDGEGSTVTINDKKDTITFTSSKLTMLNEESVLDYKIKNNSSQYDANVTINCITEENEYIEVVNTLESDVIGENYKTTLTAQEIKSGKITVELTKAVTEDKSVSVTCEINASPVERDNVVEKTDAPKWEWKSDNDANGVVSIGDELTFGSESFYVYNTENNEYKLMAKYNLEVGNATNSQHPAEKETYLQSSRAIGIKEESPTYATVKFSDNSQQYEGSIVEGYVNKYKEKLVSMGLDETTEATIISKEELDALGCNSNSYVGSHTCSRAPAFVLNTSYWTRSPDDYDTNYVWYVESDGGFGRSGYSNGYNFGVRPVLTIPTILFEGPQETPEVKPVVTNWEWTADNDNDGKVSIGDELTIGSESFYVYNAESNQYKLMAKYNLEVGNKSNSDYPADTETYLQSQKTVGYGTNYATVKFSNSEIKGAQYNSYTGSIVESYVNKYKEKLVEMGLDENIEVSLITKLELEYLGCTNSSGSCSKSPAFVTKTSYWTRSSFNDSTTYTWLVNSNSTLVGGYYLDSSGIRPVLSILAIPLERPQEKPQETKFKWMADNDNNKRVSIGDELKIGSESFYVYNTDNNEYKLIAKYNLEVGNTTNSSYPATRETYLQSSKALGMKNGTTTYGTVAFSKNNSNYTGSIVEEYVNKYQEKLADMGLTKNVEVSLITKEELESLSCDSDSDCSSAPSFIRSTSYWTRSSEGSSSIWFVASDGYFSYVEYSFNTNLGVRPVLTIPHSIVDYES